MGKILDLRIIRQLYQNLVFIISSGEAQITVPKVEAHIRVPKGRADLQLHLCIYNISIF